MSEDTNAMPFDETLDLTGAEIGFPVFPAGLVRARLTTINVLPSKSGGQNIVIKFTSEQELTTLDGSVRKPGVPFSMYIPNQASTKSPNWDWQKNKIDRLAEVKLAATGEKGGKFVSADIEGKEVLLRLGLEKNQDDEPSNAIKRVLALGGGE